ncbi:MAG: carboxypeptidase regulatory-like domain-containing protein [Candidatus Hydrogenedentes bacterium]|nr:carboxypeptidase regulatory-like domain-containing protein [Candidatus Hydrogenedentota bacterium]
MSYWVTLNVSVFDLSGNVIKDNNVSIAEADPDPRYQGSDPPSTTVDQNGFHSFRLDDLEGYTIYDVYASCTGYMTQSKRVTFKQNATKDITFYLRQ